MKTSSLRTLLALCVPVMLASMASADELGFADVDGRWPGIERRHAATSGVRQVAQPSDISAGKEELPGAYGDPFANEGSDGMHEQGSGGGSCNCGSCNGGSCGCGSCNGGDEYCCDDTSYCGDCGEYGYQPNAGMFYAEAQFIFLRAHVMEEAVGKLSEKYELTPRIVLGYEAPSGLGARARYWTYGRTTETLGQNDDPLRLDFEVIDLEGTSRFRTSHADLVIAGGFRWADITVGDDDDEVTSDMPGITFAADLRSAVCRGCRTEWAGVCGARWSLLGGDWEGDDGGVINPTRDDNVVAHEIYGGVEFLCHRCGYDLYARMVFEMQNWHSDALGDNTATDSIGFVGPAVHAGIVF